MKRNLIRLISMGVVLIMCVGVLCACNNDDDFRNPRNGEPESGEFYTLKEAYDNGWLSKGDLRNIAYYYNDTDKSYPASLDADMESKIINAKVESLLNNKDHPYLEAKTEDFEIIRYYGTYDSLNAILMNEPYSEAPTEVVDYWNTIGGVKFHHTGHKKVQIIKI